MRRILALTAAVGAAVALTATSNATASVPPTIPRAAPVASADTTASADTALSQIGIGHVFVIVLENEPYKKTYVDNPNPYLGHKLQKKATLLTHYYATGHFSLDNYLSIISGQAPNSVTSADCHDYSPFVGTTDPVTIDTNGQAVGSGCVFPANVPTLANQLSDANLSWGGFMDDMGNTPGREQKRCGVPTLTSAGTDDTQIATPKDQYAARHNPFVYFHSLLDSGLCADNVVSLSKLPKDLKHTKTTPHFDFITPDLCDDGHDAPCKGKDVAGSSAGGLTSVDHFLKKWIPTIKASPAYQKDGIIIVTSDESENTDASSCCGEQPGPNDNLPGITGPGGGRIGTLVMGKCVAAGKKDSTPYNHYSLLRSLEDIFGITTGGTDGEGHIGYAAASGLTPFGSDLFRQC